MAIGRDAAGLSPRGLQALLVCLASYLVFAGPALAQAPVPLTVDSGALSSAASQNWTVVYSTSVHVPDARWLRLTLTGTLLAGDDAAYLELVSVHDGGIQTLTAEQLAQWQYQSAYFNGDTLLVNVVAGPGASVNRLRIENVLVGTGPLNPESICGDDDRTPITDPRIGRGWGFEGQAKCTAFLINDCARCLLSAGHCAVTGFAQVHFNIPLSDPDGTPNHPPPSDQYAVDPNSIHLLYAGVGEDWSYFGVFPNPVTGLLPAEKQGAFFELASPLPELVGQVLRISGYGTVDLDGTVPQTWNRYLTSHVGPVVDTADNVIEHQVDTTGGNSGSPMILQTGGKVAGIHTNGGCDEFLGINAGTRWTHPLLVAALGAPLGVCKPLITLIEPVQGALTVGAGTQADTIPWPMPIRFAVVADTAAIPAKATDGASAPSAMQFSANGATCLDSVPAGNEWSCAIPAVAGVHLVQAAARNAWSQVVATATGRTLFYSTTGPVTQACWPAGTPITLSNFLTKPIEQIAVGDMVAAYDLARQAWVTARVSKVYAHGPGVMGNQLVRINGTVRVTPNHLLIANGKLAFAGDVKQGDVLLGLLSSAIPVTSVAVESFSGPTWNFDLASPLRRCDSYLTYVASNLVSSPLKNNLASMVGALLYDYELTDLGVASGAATSIAHGVNAVGTVVGESGGRAFYWRQETGLVDLGPGAAYAVNSSNTIAGVSGGNAVLWDLSGNKTTLGPGAAHAINDAGTAVGVQGSNAMQWQGGVATSLGPGVAYGINNAGTIVGASGVSAVRWLSPSNKTTLFAGTARAINDAGVVVGISGSQAVRWQSGLLTPLGAGTAYAINSAGLIVGDSVGQPFIWTAADGYQPLAPLTWRWSGWTPSTARAVNKLGEIAGNGVVFGQTRAYYAIRTAAGYDGNQNLIPDVCEPGGDDCNGNGQPDALEVAAGGADCNANLTPDDCELADGVASDCNGNGLLDACDIAAGTDVDCNENGLPDACDLSLGVSADCNGNGIPDECEIAAGTQADCDGDGVLNSCELASGEATDCNGNGVPDTCDVGAGGGAADCNNNSVLDACEIATGAVPDCNGNGVPDSCDLASGFAKDCNNNGKPDSCDIALGVSQDCNGNLIPDSCDLASGAAKDCNANAKPDTCDIASGTATDCNGNGVPDNCDLTSGVAQDCNANGIPDSCDIASGFAKDCNTNGVPDSCDIASGFSTDCNANGRPDSCDIANGFAQDCNANGVPDSCDIASGVAKDCNGNSVPDSCDITTGFASDCNGNAIPDSCDLATLTSADCDGNHVPDECDIATGAAEDCNQNAVPDQCDLSSGSSLDCNANQVLDECDIASGTADDCDSNGVPDHCDLTAGAADCDQNSVPDVCDIAAGAQEDCDRSGVPDTCELASGIAADCNQNEIPDSCDIAAGQAPDTNFDGIPDGCQDCNGNGIPDPTDITTGLSADDDNNALPDECQQITPPAALAPPPGATGVSTNPVLVTLVNNNYGGAMDVRFYTVGQPATKLLTSEADWAGGTFDQSKTDGTGSLVLAPDDEFYGDGSAGDLVIPNNTTVTLTSSAPYRNVTVGSGATLDLNGFILRVSEKLTNSGTITDQASGGAGGAGGDGARGADPLGNDAGGAGPAGATAGACGQPGAPGLAGGGAGGTGGGGGSGGGGAWSIAKGLDAGGGWLPDGDPAKRGRGGDGGKGGGSVRVQARRIANNGVIHADGKPGQPGQPGGQGGYTAGSGIDLAGGGGGGGGGGAGGRGGTVMLRYQILEKQGTLRAAGGAGGQGGAGGLGRTCVIGASPAFFGFGTSGNCGGGTSGRGEYLKTKSSWNGAPGSAGANGQAGSVSHQAFTPGLAPLATWTSAPICVPGGADWTNVALDATLPAQTGVSLAFSSGDGVWHSNIHAVPDSACLQVRVTMTSSLPAATPTVRSVQIGYTPRVLLGERLDMADGASVTWPWVGLQPNTNYCWNVEASNGIGQSALSPVWCFTTGAGGATCAADLNGDGAVNDTDLGLMLDQFSCPSNCPADLTGDGKVTDADLGIMLDKFNKPC